MSANWNFPRWPVAKKQAGVKRTLRIIGLAVLFSVAAAALLCHIPGFPVQIGMSTGPCMEPTLHGWQPLVFVRREAKLGDVVLCDWGEGRMVKRAVARGTEAKRLWTVVGDNRGDSEFHLVRGQDISGVMVWPRVPAAQRVDLELARRYREELFKVQTYEGPWRGPEGADRMRAIAWERATNGSGSDAGNTTSKSMVGDLQVPRPR